jgi:hypothetical protein
MKVNYDCSETIKTRKNGKFYIRKRVHSNSFLPETSRISPVSAQPKLR